MKVLALICCFLGVALANYETENRITLPCPTYSTTSAEMTNMWICEFIDWKYIIYDWTAKLLGKCPQYNVEQFESACPAENTFECCNGTQECQDVMGCKMCICQGGKFRNPKALFEVWKESKETYKHVYAAYEDCASTLPDLCDVPVSGSGSGSGEEDGINVNFP